MRTLALSLILCCGGLALHCCGLALVVQAEEVSADTLRLLKTFRDEFVELKPGGKEQPADFAMGRVDGAPAEQPAHRVTLRGPFAIARYEVPQNLWQAVMGRNPSRWQGPRNSVEMLSWADARAFCDKATALLRQAKLIEPRQRVRLPSEAEWEYACRAGSTTLFGFGDKSDELADYAWFHGNAAGNDPPVGVKKPNAWMLYDMHGYLWEWCADAWHESYDGAPADGSAWTDGGDAERRVLRGGSWKDPAQRLTSSFRRSEPATFEDDAVGLRCVLADKAE